MVIELILGLRTMDAIIKKTKQTGKTRKKRIKKF